MPGEKKTVTLVIVFVRSNISSLTQIVSLIVEIFRKIPLQRALRTLLPEHDLYVDCVDLLIRIPPESTNQLIINQLHPWPDQAEYPPTAHSPAHPTVPQLEKAFPGPVAGRSGTTGIW